MKKQNESLSQFKKIIISLVFMILPLFAIPVLLPATSMAVDCNDNATFFGLPTWYKGLTEPSSDGKSCVIKTPSDNSGSISLSAFIWKIVLNVIDIGLRLVGLIAVIFIILGGFKYITSAGDPANMKEAKQTITNAIIGLVLSILSVAIVNVVASTIK